MKRITKNKTVFKEYFRDPQIVWIYCDDNYLSELKKFPILDKISQTLIDSDEFKYKRKVLKQEITPYDYPEAILDGLEVNIYANEHFKNKYSHLKDINMEQDFTQFAKWWGPSLIETERLMKQEDNWILFEGCFEYKGYKMRPDVLIKENGRYTLIEVKANSYPKEEHAYDLMYQLSILESLGYAISNWTVKICTLNKLYKHNTSFTFSEVASRLFKYDWETYHKSSPYKVSNDKKIDPIIALEKSIVSEKVKNRTFKAFFEEWRSTYLFTNVIKDIEDIQLQDELKLDENEPINPNWNKIGGTYYLYYLLAKAGVKFDINKLIEEEDEKENIENSEFNVYDVSEDIAKIKVKFDKNSIFSLSGDTGFSFARKSELFNKGFKQIDSLSITSLLKKDDLKIYEKKTFSINNDRNVIEFLTKNRSKRLMQKFYLLKPITDVFILKNLIVKELRNYKYPIYMFDFETVKFAVPRFEQTIPYEQVPYQYSIHVILDNKTKIHYQWLAEFEKNMYLDFWNHFYKNIFLVHGKGTYVSYNKSFEKMIMNSFINKYPNEDISNLMDEIVNSCQDLMTPFFKKWFYSNVFNGSYSIKVVGKYFAPYLNYESLNKIQKGDQSSLQAKFWLMSDSKLFKEMFKNYDSFYFQQNWKNLREDMLKYCEYDTLSMVEIFYGLKKKVNDVLQK